MAIAKVKRVELIAHVTDRRKILKAVEEVSLLELKTHEENNIPENIKASIGQRINSISSKLNKVDFLLRMISSFSPLKQSIIDSFVPPKISVKRKDFEKILDSYPLETIYKRAEELDINFHHIELALKESSNSVKQLKPWQNLKFNPGHEETMSTYTIFGTITKNKEDGFKEVIENENLPLNLEIISRDSDFSYILVHTYKKNRDDFHSLAQNFDFSIIKLPQVKTTIQNEIEELKTKIEKYKNDRKGIIAEISKLNDYQKKLLISKVFLQNELNKAKVEDKIIHTDNTFVVEGYLKEEDTSKLKDAVAKTSDKYAITFNNPTKDETPPVILKNPRWLKPLEAVTELYGMPSYNELDPTPFLAPFFLISFGLAIGDVGYGLMLIVLAWMLRKSKRLSEKSKVFLVLFIYGGFAAIIAGIITGSWLALDQSILPPVLKKLILFYPIDEPALFLIITLLFGLVQLYFGVFLKLIAIAREQTLSKALQSQLPTLILVPGVSLLVAQFLGLPLSSIAGSTAKYLTLSGVFGIIIFSEIEAKNIISRIGGGLYNLYSMSSLLGDTISYGRIMALGLATYLIGSTINTMIIGDASISLFKILLLVSIFPLFHLLNLLINTISAFVHPARLQYVEFFSKFFEGGGSRFKPLSFKKDNIIIE